MDQIRKSCFQFFSSLRLLNLLTLVLTLSFGAKPVLAHNDVCPDGQPYKWNTSSTSFWRDATMSIDFTGAVNNSQTNFNTSDFDFITSPTSPAPASFWKDLGSPDPAVAGQTNTTVNCVTHRITVSNSYFNLAHFSATVHNSDQKQCTAIHELGHAVGLAHNTFTSIMLGDHNTRCHGGTVIKTLQAHDTGDINAKY